VLNYLSFHFTDFYHKVTELRSRGIKVLIALGGWNDSLGDKYSRLVNSLSARANFVTTIVEFIEKYSFDGLDLDWEYPKCWQVSAAGMEYSVSAGVVLV
jgi:chitinase